ncbi:ornithine carbamoyltransferase [Clostridium sp. YIM B02551]|uniref:ornithine carbamoyltransferase n=1 Tax=Clostridium sp. YIM B02551 TaxID=2910679 RepID=UPI001EECBD1B|nr:peptide transporter [Clostridium sp. YIM B02551]
MRNLLRITDLSKHDIEKIFIKAKELETNSNSEYLKNKIFILFFPNSSIRTRVTFEKGITSLGGQVILFPSETLDKKEDIKDVVSYLENWADGIIVRHPDISLIEKMCKYTKIPIINAMTSENHPCEILSDLYSIKKLRENYLELKYTFVGADGNIGRSWAEASKVLKLRLTQVCPQGYEMSGDLGEFKVLNSMEEGLRNTDIVLTDPLPEKNEQFESFQVTTELMLKANDNALLNPCPPFFRGEEVSAEVIESKYFVGYEFKKALLYVQQAIILFCLEI